MDLFNKHADAIVVISAIIVSMIWMNGKFNDVDKQFANVDKEMAIMKTEIAVIKTVLLMKNVLPAELVRNEGEK